MKTLTKYELTRTGIGALVVLIIALAFVGYSVGATLGSTTVTIASTTERITVSTSEFTTMTETVTESSLTVQTSIEYVTVTEMGPSMVEISGTAVTKQPGTTAESVIFISASTNSTFLAKVASGRYTISVPNHDSYNSFIEFVTAVSIGGGRCSVGGAWVYVTSNQTQTFNLSC